MDQTLDKIRNSLEGTIVRLPPHFRIPLPFKKEHITSLQ